MYAVPVDVLRLFNWVWLVSLVCIIKLYLMLVLIKRLYEIVIIMKNLSVFHGIIICIPFVVSWIIIVIEEITFCKYYACMCIYFFICKPVY